jgi:hypothetical protein
MPVADTQKLNDPHTKSLSKLPTQDASLHGGVPPLPRTPASIKEDLVAPADRPFHPGLDYLSVIEAIEADPKLPCGAGVKGGCLVL